MKITIEVRKDHLNVLPPVADQFAPDCPVHESDDPACGETDLCPGWEDDSTPRAGQARHRRRRGAHVLWGFAAS